MIEIATNYANVMTNETTGYFSIHSHIYDLSMFVQWLAAKWSSLAQIPTEQYHRL